MLRSTSPDVVRAQAKSFHFRKNWCIYPPQWHTLTYMGGHVGRLANTVDLDEETTILPAVKPPVRRFTDLLNQREASDMEHGSLDGIACPTSDNEDNLNGVEVGPYNPVSLAGRALSLSASLSPDYLQAYLAGLEDLSALRTLPEPSRRRR